MKTEFRSLNRSGFELAKVALFWILCVGVIDPAVGLSQGKLSQFRKTVHKKDAKKSAPEPKKNEPARSKNDSRDGHRHAHRNRKRRGGFGFGAISFGSSCVRPCPPTTVVNVLNPPVVEPVYVSPVPPAVVDYGSPQPVILEQPIIDAPVPPTYEPSAVETIHVDSAPVDSATLATTSIYETPFEPTVVPDFGQDWFAEWHVRGEAIYGGGVDGLTVAGIQLLLQQPGGLGLDTSVKTWRESSSDYRDHLWLGDVNAVYEVVSRRDVRARVGIGLNWANDSWGGNVGLNLTAEADIRLTDRWLLTGQADIGTLGSSDFLHAQLAISRNFDRSGLTFGYDFYDVGGVQLQAIIGGLQFRF